MQKICATIGKMFLGVAALITVVGPASMNTIAVEEMPESIKNKR